MLLFLLCVKIFLARLCDVSIGTIRIILVGKGKSVLAFFVAFIEICIWFSVARDAIAGTIDSPWIMIAYAGGYATGTLVGTRLSQKIVKGNFAVQVVTSEENDKMIDAIRKEGYAVSVVDVKGRDTENEKYMMFIEIDKKNFDHLQSLIKKLDSKAFIVVNETKYVQNGFIK